MIDFVGRRFVYLFVSVAMLAVAIVAIATGGLKPGIDFSSGTTLTMVFSKPITQADVRAELSSLGYAENSVQQTSITSFVVTGDNVSADVATKLDGALKQKYGTSAVFTYTEDQGGKTVFTAAFSSSDIDQSDVEAVVQGAGVTNPKVTQSTAPAAFLARTKYISESAGTDASGNPTPSEISKLETAFQSEFGNFGVFDVYSVDPAVASDVVKKAFIAVAVACIAILLYITLAFRRMPNPFRWGTCAVIALIHDALFVIGVFAILGRTLGVQVDAMFISAVLTVVGYSVHDTIVVFDRLRENIRLGISRDFPTTVDFSLNQTLGRSLSTSLTVVFVLLALFLIGGSSTRDFVLTMLVGIIVGTYSSIFVASQLLVVWHNREWRRFLPFLRTAPEAK